MERPHGIQISVILKCYKNGQQLYFAIPPFEADRTTDSDY